MRFVPIRLVSSVIVLFTALAIAGCETSSAPSAPPGPPADLVIVGGTIVPVGGQHESVEALAARDGKIVAVGSRTSVEALIGDDTRVVELAAGELAIPGFIEGHGHFVGIGDSAIQLDLRTASSWQDIVDQVRAAAAATPAGQWIRGRGWHQDKWQIAPEPAVEGFPIHDTLTAAAPDNPVILTHASGHAIFVNAAALTQAGIDAATDDPPGGEILHDSTGRPTGLLRETAAGLVARAYTADGEAPADELRRMIELASAHVVENGITSFHDAGSSFDIVDALAAASEDGALAPRLWIMIRASNDDLRARMAEYKGDRDQAGHVRVGGIKLSIDGAPRVAWCLVDRAVFRCTAYQRSQPRADRSRGRDRGHRR